MLGFSPQTMSILFFGATENSEPRLASLTESSARQAIFSPIVAGVSPAICSVVQPTRLPLQRFIGRLDEPPLPIISVLRLLRRMHSQQIPNLRANALLRPVCEHAQCHAARPDRKSR
jgi:hypothetical protein